MLQGKPLGTGRSGETRGAGLGRAAPAPPRRAGDKGGARPAARKGLRLLRLRSYGCGSQCECGAGCAAPRPRERERGACPGRGAPRTASAQPRSTDPRSGTPLPRSGPGWCPAGWCRPGQGGRRAPPGAEMPDAGPRLPASWSCTKVRGGGRVGPQRMELPRPGCPLGPHLPRGKSGQMCPWSHALPLSPRPGRCPLPARHSQASAGTRGCRLCSLQRGQALGGG